MGSDLVCCLKLVVGGSLVFYLSVGGVVISWLYLMLWL